MMNQLIGDFTKHLATAIQIGKSAEFKTAGKKIDNVLICGLGGSGIGGTIIAQMVKNQISIPVATNKDYFIPEFVGENTLVVCSSYSGNTEETLQMYEQAKSKNAEIVVVTSGGKFQELADKEGHNFIKIPGGLPPRAAFGLGFPQLFFVLEKYGLIEDSFISQIESTILSIDAEESSIREEAKAIANKLNGKIPVIYSEDTFEGVCVRFRQQINENSKRLAWHATLPEMNHNEIVGWRRDYSELAVLFFRSSGDFYRNQKREEYLKKVISDYNQTVISVNAKGDTLLERALYLVHIGDWISEYFGEINKVDTTEVNVITGLKNMLADLD